MSTRPTSDRLRETLFNVLGPRVAGARFVDLYAGSGAVAIEALSRGAAHVVLVEHARGAVTAIRGNLAALGLATRATVEAREVERALPALLKTPQPAGIVFLDPPYDADEAYASTLQFLAQHHAALLDEDALVVAEHSSKKELPARVGALERTRVLRQGDAALSFYRVAEA